MVMMMTGQQPPAHPPHCYVIDVRPLPWIRGQSHLVELHLPPIRARALGELETTHGTSAACKVFGNLNFPGNRSEFVHIQACKRRSITLPSSMSYSRGLTTKG